MDAWLFLLGGDLQGDSVVLEALGTRHWGREGVRFMKGGNWVLRTWKKAWRGLRGLVDAKRKSKHDVGQQLTVFSTRGTDFFRQDLRSIYSSY